MCPYADCLLSVAISKNNNNSIIIMGNERQFFDFETMAVVLYAMLESGVILGKEHFSMMSAIDGTRGPDGFSHQFRKVKVRAKEIQEKMKNGAGVGTPVKKTRGGSNKAKSTPSRSEGKKCGECNKRKLVRLLASSH